MLKHTLQRLQNKKPLTVAYFGGSITEGAGASSPDKCWRSKITAYLKAAYPASEITEIQAAIGGTDSALGIFRADNDMLRYHPDLVFLEFAVNDNRSEKSLSCNETIIRKIYYQNPEADIVLIRTVTESMYFDLKDGKRIASYDAYDILSRHYGLDLVDVGAELISRCQSGEGDFSVYTKDKVHPNDLGYTLYTNRILTYLKSALALPKAITGEKLIHAGMVRAEEAAKGDFTVHSEKISRLDGYIELSHKGDTVTFAFTGTAVGLYHQIGKDSGDYEWSVDGGAFQRKSMWDTYALQFDRPAATPLTFDLPEGEHLLTVRALGEKNEQSKGTILRIAAFTFA